VGWVDFSKIKPGLELPPVSHKVTRGNILKFGAMVGGFNPEHEDDRFAEKVGFEGMFAHGVMHLSYITQMLCDFAGHPDRILKIDVRFGKPVYPGDVVTAKGVIKGVRTTGDVLRVTCDVWSENQHHDRVIYDGTAEIKLSE
jgi:acyl dehydratase